MMKEDWSGEIHMTQAMLDKYTDEIVDLKKNITEYKLKINFVLQYWNEPLVAKKILERLKGLQNES